MIRPTETARTTGHAARRRALAERELLDGGAPRCAYVWDAWLGGFYNHSADRELARQLDPVKHWPIAHRQFLVDAVTRLAARGIRQFVDLGGGLPSVGNGVGVVLKVPGARVVCVDHDPVVVGVMTEHYRDELRVTVIEAELRHPDRLLDESFLAAVDLGEPVGFLAVAVLQHLGPREPGRLFTSLRDATVTGSYLAVSHPSPGRRVPAHVRAALTRFPGGWTPRPAGAAAALLRGWAPLAPGVVPVTAWPRPRAGPLAHAWAVLAKAAPIASHWPT